MSNCTIFNLDERALKPIRAIMLTKDYNVEKNADGTVSISFNVGGRYGLTADADGITITAYLSNGDYSTTIKRSRYAFVQLS